MKRIALCLHGQLRPDHNYFYVEKSWHEFIKRYDPDVYWHTWTGQGLPSFIFNNNLKSGLIEAPREYNYHGVTEWASTARNVGPQFESIGKVLNMVWDADFIVRSRWDLMLHNPAVINFDLLDPNKYYVCGNHWAGHPDMIDDNIMIGSRDNILYDNSLRAWLDIFWIRGRGLIPSGEQLISSYFKEHDLMKDVIKTELLNFTLARNL